MSYLFPSFSSSDFEEIDLDVEESKQDSHPHPPPGDIEPMDSFEVVKLPEEKSVPATNTCPCVCHQEPANVSFYTRTKHCNKCCLKVRLVK